MSHKVLIFTLILANVLMGPAMAEQHHAPGGSGALNLIRRLGMHGGGEREEAHAPAGEHSSASGDSGEVVEPRGEANEHGTASGDSRGEAHPPALSHHHHHHHYSVAGGGVILGGLASAFLVSVFCYIRATRRHKSESDQTKV